MGATQAHMAAMAADWGMYQAKYKELLALEQVPRGLKCCTACAMLRSQCPQARVAVWQLNNCLCLCKAAQTSALPSPVCPFWGLHNPTHIQHSQALHPQ